MIYSLAIGEIVIARAVVGAGPSIAVQRLLFSVSLAIPLFTLTLDRPVNHLIGDAELLESQANRHRICRLREELGDRHEHHV